MRAKIHSLIKHRNSRVFGSVLIGVLAVLAVVGVLYNPYHGLPVPPADAQSVVPNLSGWMWSSNVGWFSVNCANTTGGCVGPSGSWGLRLETADANGKRFITGYAWNNSIGWVKFDHPTTNYPSETGTIPSSVYVDMSNSSATTYPVLGWARACSVFSDNQCGTTADKSLKADSARGGWDGWISLGRNSGSPAYGVTVDKTIVDGKVVLKFNGSAFGSTVLGWTNFNPKDGYGVVCDEDGPCPVHRLTVTMNGNKAGLVTGTEDIPTPPITIDCSFNGAGAAGGICSHDYPEGALVTLVATTPNFKGWTGPDVPATCTGTPIPTTCAVKMDKVKTVTATFDDQLDYTLTVVKTSTDGGSGTVTSNVGGIVCGAGVACQANYPHGSVVILSYTLVADSSFGGWSDSCDSTGDFVGDNKIDCRIVMSSNRQVSAHFDGVVVFPATLELHASPETFGKDGGTTKLTWTSTHVKNNTCTQIASPTNDDWDLSGQPNKNETTGVAADVTETTTFTITCEKNSGGAIVSDVDVTVGDDDCDDPDGCPGSNTRTLTVVKNGNQANGGTVTSSPAGIDCGAGCTTEDKAFTKDINVTLTAAGQYFKGWSGPDVPATCTGTPIPTTCTVKMDEAKTVTATFSDGTAPLPACISAVRASGLNIMTVNLPSSGYVIPPTSFILEVVGADNVKAKVTTQFDASWPTAALDKKAKMCVMTGTAPTPGNCLTDSTIDNLAGGIKNRRLWMYVPDPLRTNPPTSDYMTKCTNNGCKITVIAEAIDPPGTCNSDGAGTGVFGPGRQPFDFFIKFQDSTIAPQ